MAESAHRRDFFISYNHRDCAWAEWIAWELEKNGFTVVIQAWDFGAGSNFVIEMDAALRDAQRVIAVLSPNYLESNFTLSEWAAPFSNDPKGKGRKLIPVRVQEVDVDGLLGQIVYIDLVGKDERTAKTELLDKLRESRGKPKQKPKFPASKPALFPGTELNHRSQKSVKFEMVLSGTLDEANKSRVEAVVRHLQNLLDEPNLTLQEVRAGSIVLELQCSQAAFDRLRLLRASGQLDEVMGVPVQEIRAVGGQSSDKALQGKETLSLLVGALHHRDRSVLNRAVEELGRMGAAAKSVVPALISLLEDKEVQVRTAAVDVLGQLGPEAASSVPALVRLLQHKEAYVRTVAVDVLGRLGPAAVPAVPALIALLQTKDAGVCNRAVDALGRLRDAAASAVPALIALLHDEDPLLRKRVMYALDRIGRAPARAVPALITLLQDSDMTVRQQAIYALSLIGPSAVPAVTDLLQHKDTSVRECATAVLVRIAQADCSAVRGSIISPSDENSPDPEPSDDALRFKDGSASPEVGIRTPTPETKPS